MGACVGQGRGPGDDARRVDGHPRGRRGQRVTEGGALLVAGIDGIIVDRVLERGSVGRAGDGRRVIDLDDSESETGAVDGTAGVRDPDRQCVRTHVGLPWRPHKPVQRIDGGAVGGGGQAESEGVRRVLVERCKLELKGHVLRRCRVIQDGDDGGVVRIGHREGEGVGIGGAVGVGQSDDDRDAAHVTLGWRPADDAKAIHGHGLGAGVDTPGDRIPVVIDRLDGIEELHVLRGGRRRRARDPWTGVGGAHAQREVVEGIAA